MHIPCKITSSWFCLAYKHNCTFKVSVCSCTSPYFIYTIYRIYLTMHSTHLITHMVKDYSESYCCHSLATLNDILNVPFRRQDSTYNGLCYTICGALEIAQWVHHEELIQRPITPWGDALSQSYMFLLIQMVSRDNGDAFDHIVGSVVC